MSTNLKYFTKQLFEEFLKQLKSLNSELIIDIDGGDNQCFIYTTSGCSHVFCILHIAVWDMYQQTYFTLALIRNELFNEKHCNSLSGNYWVFKKKFKKHNYLVIRPTFAIILPFYQYTLFMYNLFKVTLWDSKVLI